MITQAQIEAAQEAYRLAHIKGDHFDALTAALTAAAQAEHELYTPQMLRGFLDETIERCAQVADRLRVHGVADEIRKLKVDPNLIYPGKDPDFTFPEEE